MAGNNTNTIQIVVSGASSPTAMATALAALTSSQLLALANALVLALQSQNVSGIPATGVPYINDSGFVVVSQ